MRTLTALLTFGALLTVPALADAPASKLTPNDFASGLALHGQPGLAVQTFLLPLEVYRAARADLSDLSVFDAQGKPVAWALRTVPEVAQREVHEDVLPAFPIYGQPSAQASALRLSLSRADDGMSVLDVHAVGPESASKDGKLLAYILATPNPKQALDGLRFELAPAQANVLFALKVEASDDLSSWQLLTDSAAIGQLSHEGQTVARTRIALRTTHAPFLRVTWSGESPPQFAKISAEREHVRAESPLAPRHVTLGPAPLREGAYRVDLGGNVPLSSVTPLLPAEEVLLRGALWLSSGADDRAREVFSGSIYRLTHASETLTSAPIVLSAQRARVLTLQIDARGAEPPKEPLAFDVGYAPDQLLYVAHGAGAHLLAFGSHKREGSPYDASQLLAFLSPEQRAALPLESAKAGEARVLGGEGARLVPKQPLPVRTIALWSVLVAGAATLIVFALRLLRKNRGA